MAAPTTRAEFKEYCLRNKYSEWYFKIIDNALLRNWNKASAGVYVEKHHYIPTSLGGTDNHIVFLTSREHFIVHLLLVRMLTGNDKSKMAWAVMCLKGKGRYINSRLYEHVKSNIKHTDEARAKMSLSRKGKRTGAANSNYGNRGNLNPLFGTKQTMEHKNKRIQKLKGRKQTTISRMKMSANRPHGPSGKKWFNNGIRETFDIPENKPSDYVFGRLKRRG